MTTRLLKTCLFLLSSLGLFLVLIFMSVTVTLNSNFQGIYAQDQSNPCPQTMTLGDTYVDKQGCIQPCPASNTQGETSVGCPQLPQPQNSGQSTPQPLTQPLQIQENKSLKNDKLDSKFRFSDSPIIKDKDKKVLDYGIIPTKNLTEENPNYPVLYGDAYLTVFTRFNGVDDGNFNYVKNLGICIKIKSIIDEHESDAVPFCSQNSENGVKYIVQAPGKISVILSSLLANYGITVGSGCNYLMSPGESKGCILDISLSPLNKY